MENGEALQYKAFARFYKSVDNNPLPITRPITNMSINCRLEKVMFLQIWPVS